MIYDLRKELKKNFKYWSNSCGDLFHKGEYAIDKIEELPQQLQRVFNDLWNEDAYGARCYLAEFKGKYGIALEAAYDRCYAGDLSIKYKELVKIAKNKALECSMKYPDYDVLFGKDAVLWSDGTTDTVVMLFLPWDISATELNMIGETFRTLCYNMTVNLDKNSKEFDLFILEELKSLKNIPTKKFNTVVRRVLKQKTSTKLWINEWSAEKWAGEEYKDIDYKCCPMTNHARHFFCLKLNVKDEKVDVVDGFLKAV